MAIIACTNEELKLLARLMRAEAESDGKQGMLLVGNVCCNRALANCLDFKKITSIQKAVMQQPGGFEATYNSYFYQGARSCDIKLAQRIINGEKFAPAKYALWFYNSYGSDCKAQWFGAWNSGKYKSHCFYTPVKSENCY